MWPYILFFGKAFYALCPDLHHALLIPFYITYCAFSCSPCQRCSYVWTVMVKIAQSCPTLCDPMDCSLPGSSVHGILQAIVLEWIAISFSKGSSQPRDRTQVSRIVDTHFTIWANVADTVHPCFNGILPQSYFSLFFKHMPAELAFFNWTIFKVFIAFVTVLLLICFDF